MSWIAALGAAGSSALDYAASKNLNDRSIKRSGRVSYDYERLMRQTAYQDTMQDMAAAGLNPILAYSQGPSAATSVGVQGQNAPPVGTNALNAFNSNLNSAQDRKVKEQQENLTRAQGLLTARNYSIAMHTEDQAKINTKILAEQLAQEHQKTSNGALDLQVKNAYLESVLHAAKVQGDTKPLQYLDRVMDSLGKLFGNGNSARTLFTPSGKD